MLRFASRSDHRLWNAVKEWTATAISTFRALETGQEAPGSYFEDHAWYNGEREGILELFMACTVELTQEASVLGLNPRPLQEAFDVVSSWDPEHNAGRIPDRGRFRVTLRSALVILGVIEEGVRSRAVKERRTPESGLTSIVPVAANGREPTSNGAQPVVPTAASPETPKEARDRFLYERLLRGDTQQKALADCNALVAVRKWNELTSEQGAVKAARKWARAQGKKPLPERRGGRRGGKK